MPKKKWGKVVVIKKEKKRIGRRTCKCAKWTNMYVRGQPRGQFSTVYSYNTSPFEGKPEIMYQAYTPRHLIHFCVLNV